MYKHINLNKKGFTLVEIMTVIFILSILISITVPNFYLLIKNNQEKENLTYAENIFVSAQNVLNDIVMNKHSVEFNPSVTEVTEKGYDYTLYQKENNSYILDSKIKTPLKIILANGNYINGLHYSDWDKDFKEEFFNNVEITYNPQTLVVKSVSYKGIIYQN